MKAVVAEIKQVIKEMGYAFNRRWIIRLPSGNYIENSKLGGWNGLELWTCGEDGCDSRLGKQSDDFLNGILAELKEMKGE